MKTEQNNNGLNRKLTFTNYLVIIPFVGFMFFVLSAKYFFPNSQIIQKYFTGYWQILILFLYFLSIFVLAIIEFFIRGKISRAKD